MEAVRPGLYAVRYRLTGTPLVSIIIPTRDWWTLLDQCLRSIEEKTSYPRYEILVLDNDTTEPHALTGLDAIARKWRVYRCPGPFNFSALNNFGASQARGEHLVFLNNDTQVVAPDWLTALLEHAQRPEVGAVGARLHYPDGRIQHAGLVLGVGGVADHAFKGLPGDRITYFGIPDAARDVSGVTAACMMVPRRAFEAVGGFDERLQVALNDVDLCLRLQGARLPHRVHALRGPVPPRVRHAGGAASAAGRRAGLEHLGRSHPARRSLLQPQPHALPHRLESRRLTSSPYAHFRLRPPDRSGDSGT